MNYFEREKDPVFLETGIGAFSSPMDDSIDNFWSERNQAAKFTTYGALDTNPDEYAKARALAKQTGTTPDAAMDFQDELRREATIRSIDFNALPKSTAKALSHLDKARLAHDDIDNMSVVEKTTRALLSSIPQLNMGFWGAVRATADAVTFGSENLVSRYAAERADKEKKYLESLLPKSDSAIERGVYSAISSLPSTLAGVGMAMFNPAAGLSFLAGVSGGQAYTEAKDKGLNTPTALRYGITQGAAEAAFERVPLLRFLGDVTAGSSFGKTLLNQLKTEVPGEQATTLVQDLDEWATLNPEKPFSEYISARPAAAVETLAATVTSSGALTSLAKGAQVVSNRIDKERQEAGKAEEVAAQLSNLNDDVQQSKLRQRAPDAFEEFVKDIAEDSPVQHVFIDAQKLAQKEIVTKLVEVSPSISAQLEEAVENGGDVRIPIEEYTARIAGTELADALLDDLKVDPEGMTFAEAQAFRQSEREVMAEQMELQAKEVEKSKLKIDEFNTIQSRIETRLGELKRFSSDVNKAYAAIPAAFFTTIADRTGKSAIELYDKYKTRIIATSLSGEKKFLQDTGDINGQFVPASVSPDGKTALVIFSSADLSTFLHESGHWFLENLADLAMTEDSLKQDVQTIFDFIGVKNLETWNSMDFESKVEGHEKFARGFEAYLREGKAPSLKLQGIFSRFKEWLRKIYLDIKDIDIELNDEIRGVFDRMLATDDQIDEARRVRSLNPLFETPESAAEFGVDWEVYQEANKQAFDDSKASLDARLVKDMAWAGKLREKTIKRFRRDALDKRKEVQAEVEAELSDTPIYRAIRFLKYGEIKQDGEDIKVEQGSKLNAEMLKQMYPESGIDRVNWKSLKYGKYGMLSDDGLHPDIVADIFGFQSGDALVRELLSAAPFKEAVSNLTDKRVFERYGDITSEEALNKATDEAIFNDISARVIAREFAALKGIKGDERVLLRAAKEYAKKLIGKTTIRDLKPQQYLAAAARAGKAADKAFKVRDLQETVNQKRIQLINHSATREAFEAEARIKDTLAFFRNVARKKDADISKTRNMDIVNVARAILEQYGIGNSRVDIDSRIGTLKQNNKNVYDALEMQIYDAQRTAKPFKELTVHEVQALKDTIDSLWTLAKREREIEIDGRRLNKATIVNQLIVSAGKNITPKVKRAGEKHAVSGIDHIMRGLQTARAALRRVESWCESMGPEWTEFIYQPVKEAANRMRIEQTEYAVKLEELLKKIEPKLVSAKISAPELDYTFGHQNGGVGKIELLGALLHTGNQSSKEKLLLGRGWGVKREDGTLDSRRWDMFLERAYKEEIITQSDMDFVQSVWDLLETTKPMAQNAYRTIYGRYFDEVTAQEIITPFGNYKGGYYPAVRDPFMVPEEGLTEQLQTVTEGADYMFPVTQPGFAKSRTEYNKPLAMDIRLIKQHINKVLTFSHMSVPVKDVAGILNDRELKGVLTELDPAVYNNVLIPWLNRAAKQIVESPIPGWTGKYTPSKILRGLRSNVGMNAMFLNVANAMQNITGNVTVLTKVNKASYFQALSYVAIGYSDVQRKVVEVSPFMANRLSSKERELTMKIEHILTNPGIFKKTNDFARLHSYFLQTTTQYPTDLIAWMAGFIDAEKKGLNNLDAVRYADSIVRQTQGSLDPEDISKSETGTAFTRLFTQFSSYANMTFNLMVTDAAKILKSEESNAKKATKLTSLYLKAIVIPSIISTSIAIAVQGGLDDDDEDGYLDDYLEAYIGGVGFSSISPLSPWVSSLVIPAIKAWNDNPLDDRLTMSPAIRAIEDTLKAGPSITKAISGEGSESKAIRESGAAIGTLLGIPLKPFMDRLGYAVDVANEKVEPTSELDYARGLLTGKASPESKSN